VRSIPARPARLAPRIAGPAAAMANATPPSVRPAPPARRIARPAVAMASVRRSMVKTAPLAPTTAVVARSAAMASARSPTKRARIARWIADYARAATVIVSLNKGRPAPIVLKIAAIASKCANLTPRGGVLTAAAKAAPATCSQPVVPTTGPPFASASASSSATELALPDAS
jgi:hypothetical protein